MIGRARSLLLGMPTALCQTMVMLAKSREPQDAERAIRVRMTQAIDSALCELQNTAIEDVEGDGAGAEARWGIKQR